jgi:hypothetical protein
MKALIALAAALLLSACDVKPEPSYYIQFECMGRPTIVLRRGQWGALTNDKGQSVLVSRENCVETNLGVAP